MSTALSLTTGNATNVPIGMCWMQECVSRLVIVAGLGTALVAALVAMMAIH